MMGMKGKLLKKLKTIGYLTYHQQQPERILQVSDTHIYPSPQKMTPNFPSPLPLPLVVEPEPKHESRAKLNNYPLPAPLVQEPEIIDVSELMKDLDDQDMDFDDEMDEKENRRLHRKLDAAAESEGSRSENSDENEMRRPLKAKLNGREREREFALSDTDASASSFRQPDLNSRTLFDPKLLAAFEQAITEAKAREAERRSRIIEVPSLWADDDVVEERVREPPLKARKVKLSKNDDDNDSSSRSSGSCSVNPLLEFEDKCPPGGSDAIVFYTTGLRAVRKTFEDCQKMRSLLENLRVLFFERDISMHSRFKEELWEILGGKTLLPPRLFIKGRYIGGVDEVLALHEQGKLKPLTQGIPLHHHHGDGPPCQGCAGFRFIVCFNCNGSRKIVQEDREEEEEEEPMNCTDCNENGMLVCPLCC
ncbi:uncharacterized protein LOC127243956 [Andrographis paniculata]|uniref:uncharacterized protein LOC127243956 n=1 Tax=Andrographis paniculata TaxID=175694 RepID=UPI0021E82EDC|nr:uncharacterized protein LOC127243956 [Andrographis paniculata]